jgi:hypothetical protein
MEGDIDWQTLIRDAIHAQLLVGDAQNQDYTSLPSEEGVWERVAPQVRSLLWEDGHAVDEGHALFLWLPLKPLSQAVLDKLRLDARFDSEQVDQFVDGHKRAWKMKRQDYETMVKELSVADRKRPACIEELSRRYLTPNASTLLLDHTRKLPQPLFYAHYYVMAIVLPTDTRLFVPQVQSFVEACVMYVIRRCTAYGAHTDDKRDVRFDYAIENRDETGVTLRNVLYLIVYYTKIQHPAIDEPV